ncbi:MAG: hypothetical protein ABIE03_00885 [Patescibacteria group bacterium]|nr:hypothetical protein [Patescibacteria group bacterium]
MEGEVLNKILLKERVRLEGDLISPSPDFDIKTDRDRVVSIRTGGENILQRLLPEGWTLVALPAYAGPSSSQVNILLRTVEFQISFLNTQFLSPRIILAHEMGHVNDPLLRERAAEVVRLFVSINPAGIDELADSSFDTMWLYADEIRASSLSREAIADILFEMFSTKIQIELEGMRRGEQFCDVLNIPINIYKEFSTRKLVADYFYGDLLIIVEILRGEDLKGDVAPQKTFQILSPELDGSALEVSWEWLLANEHKLVEVRDTLREEIKSIENRVIQAQGK